MEDENLEMTPETEEDDLDEATLKAIDDDWADEPDDTEPEGAEDKAEPKEEPDARPEDPEEEAQEAETEGEEAEDAEAPEEQEKQPDEAKPETQPDAGHQRYKLKVKGEEREVGLEEMTELAQKGADYDGLRADRDQLRSDKARLEDYGTFLQEMAQAGGVTVEELMESTRAHMLMQQAEKGGNPMSEEDARAQVKAKTPKQEAEKAPEKTPEEKARETIQRFLDLYPEVKGTDIPKEVWDQAEKTGDLIAPYQRWQAQQLKAERQQLEQNRKNRERSTGSRKSAGQSSTDKAFDAAWYDGT